MSRPSLQLLMPLMDSEHAFLQDSANRNSANDLRCNSSQRSFNAAVGPSTYTIICDDYEQSDHQAMSIRKVLWQGSSANPWFRSFSAALALHFLFTCSVPALPSINLNNDKQVLESRLTITSRAWPDPFADWVLQSTNLGPIRV